jgi:hypothetical protein
MHLLTAWVASALAGAVAYPIGALISAALLGAPSVVLRGLLRFNVYYLYVLAFCLVLQLVYGGLLYLVLARFGWLTLPVILAAYIVPLILFHWFGSDVPKDLIMAIPHFLVGASLAIVAWLLVRA